MVDGSLLWEGSADYKLFEKEYFGRTYELFDGVPDNLYRRLEAHAADSPEKVFLVDDDGTKTSFRSFLEKVERFAAYLTAECGIGPGDRVALMLFNSSEFCTAFLALIRIGAVMLPLPSKFRRSEIMQLIERSDIRMAIADIKYSEWMLPLEEKGIRVLITEKPLGGYALDPYQASDEAAAAALIPEEILPEAPAVLMYTSGTTSLSKGVLLTNFNLMHAAEAYRLTLGIQPSDSCVIPVPIYLVTGLVALFSLTLHVGGTVYLIRFFDSNRVLDTIMNGHVTFVHAAPTVYSLLLKEKVRYPELPSLRLAACGGGPIPREKILEFHRWLPRTDFRTVYGMTETSSPATVLPQDAVKDPHVDSVGIPVPGLKIRIVDPCGSEVEPMQTGEVQLKGSVILKEYDKLPGKGLDQEGWLSTGDVGYLTQDGFLVLVDRIKDMIDRGGEKICSYDIERELYQMPGVEEAAVVGIPDALYGESAAAVIRCRKGCSLTEENVKEFLKPRVARYKIPSRVIFTEDIPTTPNGKVNKREIRKLFTEADQ